MKLGRIALQNFFWSLPNKMNTMISAQAALILELGRAGRRLDQLRNHMLPASCQQGLQVLLHNNLHELICLSPSYACRLWHQALGAPQEWQADLQVCSAAARCSEGWLIKSDAICELEGCSSLVKRHISKS